MPSLPKLTYRHGQFLLFFLVLIVFYPVWDATLIQLDDPKHIWENTLVSPPNLKGLLTLWKEPYFGLYVPVTYSVWSFLSFLSHTLLGRLAPMFFHGANLALHLANTLLVFSLIRSLLNKEKTPASSWLPAFLGAAFFAVHPVQVETVAWISCLKDLLCTLFSLLCLKSFLQVWQNGLIEGKMLWLPTLYFLLALFSKPSAVILPAACVLLGLYTHSVSDLRKLPRAILFWLGLCTATAFAVVWVTKNLQPTSAQHFVTAWWTRPLIALDAIGFYFAKVLWPWTLSLDYGRTPFEVTQLAWRDGLWLIPLFVLPLCWSYRKELWAVGVGLFVLGVLPILGLVPFLFQMFSTVADHYLSFSLIGASLSLAAILARASVPALRLSGVGLTLLAVASLTQAQLWKDGIAIFQQAVKVNPRSLLAHNNLGVEFQSRGNFGNAAFHFRKAIALSPERADLFSNLGAALVSMGEVREGLIYLHKAESFEKKSPVALYNLARAYLRLGDFKKAKQFSDDAAARDPHFRPPGWVAELEEPRSNPSF